MAKYYDLIYGNKDKVLEECNFLESIFRMYCCNRPLKILDIGCGTGSHALVLSERGYSVIGIDQSEKMIKIAKNKVEKGREYPFFLVQNMKHIELPEKVDVAICLFNSFGYLVDDLHLEGFFASLHECLKDDSLFIFEFWNIEGVKPTPYKRWTKRQQDNLMLYRFEQSDYHMYTGILESEKEFIVANNMDIVDNFIEVHRLKCYTVSELRLLFERYNFQLVAVFDFDKDNKIRLKKPDRRTFRIIGVAKSNR